MAKTKKTKKVDHVVLEWDAPEYLQYHRGPKWYMAALAVVLISVAIALLTANWTMGVAIVVFAAVYYYIQTQHPPKMIHISMTEMGVNVGDMFFPYSHIQAFWIIYHNSNRTLNLRVAKRVISDVVIQLNHQDPVPVRQFMAGQVPEWEGKNERLSDIVLRLLRL